MALEGRAPDIWSLDLERDVATRLTFSEGPDFAAVWSPDGESVVFASRRGGQSNVWRKSAEGTREAEQVTESDHFQVPSSWSADGRYLLINEDGSQTEMDLMVLDVEAGTVEPYLQTEFNEESGEFSPNGRWIAYESDESGKNEIYVRPFPMAPGKWRVSSEGGIDPVWSPDGGVLFYRGADKKFYSAAVTVEGEGLRVGTVQALFDDHFDSYRGRSYDIAPDGSFLFMAAEGAMVEKRDLPILVFNWFAELEQLVPLKR